MKREEPEAGNRIGVDKHARKHKNGAVRQQGIDAEKRKGDISQGLQYTGDDQGPEDRGDLLSFYRSLVSPVFAEQNGRAVKEDEVNIQDESVCQRRQLDREDPVFESCLVPQEPEQGRRDQNQPGREYYREFFPRRTRIFRKDPRENDQRALHQKRDNKAGRHPPSGPEAFLVKIPKDEIFDGPERQKCYKGGEGLVRAQAGICYKDVESQENQEEERKKMKQDEHPGKY